MRKKSEKWYTTVDPSGAPSTTLDLTYTTTYDAASRVATVGDGTASLGYEYSILGNLTSQTQTLDGLSDEVRFDYAYDAAGRKAAVAASIGGTPDYINEYDFDNLGRVTRVTQSGANVAEKRIDLAYADDGLSSTITRYADLAGEHMVAATDQAFDAMGRTESITHKRADTVFADYSYEWDEASRITEIDFDFLGTAYDDTATYGYDDTSQLTAESYNAQADHTYDYDQTGNRDVVDDGTASEADYTTGDHNRLLNDGTYTYQYDVEGNIVRRTNIATGEYVVNDWDHRNRLIRVTNYNSSDVATRTVEYAYDANNRMYKRVLDSDGDGTLSTATVFVRCDDQIAMELERSDSASMSASDLKTRQLWLPGSVDHHLAQESIAQANTLWTLGDHLNTVRDVVEYVQATGAVNLLNHIDYDAPGNITFQSDATMNLIAYFTGRWRDDATGNQYNRERWYASSISRWLSTDPIGFKAGDVNLYRYVGNQLLLIQDPSGLAPPNWIDLDEDDRPCFREHPGIKKPTPHEFGTFIKDSTEYIFANAHPDPQKDQWLTKSEAASKLPKTTIWHWGRCDYSLLGKILVYSYAEVVEWHNIDFTYTWHDDARNTHNGGAKTGACFVEGTQYHTDMKVLFGIYRKATQCKWLGSTFCEYEIKPQMRLWHVTRAEKIARYEYYFSKDRCK